MNEENDLLKQIKANVANLRNALGFISPNENPAIISNKMVRAMHQTQSCLYAITSYIEQLDTRLKTLENECKND
jgi:hypothetical protein